MISRPDFHAFLRCVASADERSAADFIVATVWSADGSTPLPEGSRALIGVAGLVAGTVGGGAVEQQTLHAATEVRHRGLPQVLTFDLQGSGGDDPAAICGGRLRILLQPLLAKERAAFAAATGALERRERGLLQTTLHPGPGDEVQAATHWIEARVLDEASDRAGEVAARRSAVMDPAAARLCLAQETSRRSVLQVPTGRMEDALATEVLWEPVVPRPVLLIVGGGHVGQALAAQAHLVGFAIAVLDDRPGFLAPEAFPEGVRLIEGPLRPALDAFPFASDTYVAVMTRGHRGDAEALAACLRRPTAYLGMIGSRRKVTLLREQFLADGRATPEEWGRVHAPIGLDLGAISAPEIAASIVAELIAVRRHRPLPVGRSGMTS